MAEEEMPEWMKRTMEQNKKDYAEYKEAAAEAYEDIVGDKFKPKADPEPES